MAYKSGFERALVAQLNRAKVPFEYETLKLKWVSEHVYRPDFILPNGIIIEAKGRFMKGDVAKMLAIKKQYPELDIRFVFQDAHKSYTRKTTYAMWADKNGFLWADGNIPKEWLDEPKH